VGVHKVGEKLILEPVGPDAGRMPRETINALGDQTFMSEGRKQPAMPVTEEGDATPARRNFGHGEWPRIRARAGPERHELGRTRLMNSLANSEYPNQNLSDTTYSIKSRD
jgi:hypothetical protein